MECGDLAPLSKLFFFLAALNHAGNTKAVPGRSTPQAAPIRFMQGNRTL